MLNVLSVISGFLSGLAKLAGSIGLYLAGKRGAELKSEKNAKEGYKKDAKRWKNRPRNKSDAVVRMRDYKPDND